MSVLDTVGGVVGGAFRKVRNLYRTLAGADLEDRPRDPDEPPGGNASGNVGGLGGGANW